MAVQILVVAAQEVLGTSSAGQEVGRPELIGLRQAQLAGLRGHGLVTCQVQIADR